MISCGLHLDFVQLRSYRDIRETEMSSWFGNKAHIDREKAKAKAKAGEDLKRLIETGDEDAYVAYLKRLAPNITSERLVSLIQEFRELRRKRASGSSPSS